MKLRNKNTGGFVFQNTTDSEDVQNTTIPGYQYQDVQVRTRDVTNLNKKRRKKASGWFLCC